MDNTTYTQDEIDAAYDALDMAHGYTDAHGTCHPANPAEIERLTALLRRMDGGPY